MAFRLQRSVVDLKLKLWFSDVNLEIVSRVKAITKEKSVCMTAVAIAVGNCQRMLSYCRPCKRVTTGGFVEALIARLASARYDKAGKGMQTIGGNWYLGWFVAQSNMKL